jgi:type IV pilus assembly protein PilA
MFKSIKKRLKNQRGLTLVELLAVVVILGIIAAIAVPNIGKLIDKTEKDAQVAEGIQIINAAKIYMNSKKVDFTNVPTGNGADSDDTAETIVILDSQLVDYLDNVKDSDYKVIVTKTAGNGKYTYVLKNHTSAAVVNAGTADVENSETELLAY